MHNQKPILVEDALLMVGVDILLKAIINPLQGLYVFGLRYFSTKIKPLELII